MKILMFYAPVLWFKTYEKALPDVPDQNIENSTKIAVVVFYHAEAEDENNRSRFILRSSAFVASSFAMLWRTGELISEARARLENVGLIVVETPFGYLNEWKIHVAGDSRKSI